MALNDITFIKGRGGLGRTLAGEDHVSGLYFEAAALPEGFGGEKVKQILSPDDAIKKGIVKGSTEYGVLYYHISEFFRINEEATLYVGIFTENTSFEGIMEMQNYAEGKIRQIGVFSATAFDALQVSALQAVADDCFDAHMPLSVLFASNIKTVADLTTLPDLRALEKPNVTVIIGQDGAAEGARLFTASNYSISCLGAALGVLSLSAVNESIAWVQKFNMAEVELDTPALSNGMIIKSGDKTTISLLNTLNSLGYVFLRKHVGSSGTFFNDSHTCDAATSDYAYIESVRTLDKAIRGVRTYMLPMLNGTVYVDATTGQLTPDTIATLETMGSRALEEMERAGEISGQEVYINPDQNILATSELEVSIKDVPTGVIRNMKIHIGHVAKL